MRLHRYGPIEIGPTLLLSNKIAQEHAHGGYPLLSGSRTVPIGACEEKRAHLLGIPSTGLITQRIEQLAGPPAILPEGRLCCASMDLKPMAKAGDKRRFAGLGSASRLARADAELHQILVKAPYTEKGVVIDLAPVR
jgi:hypothetical protein